MQPREAQQPGAGRRSQVQRLLALLAVVGIAACCLAGVLWVTRDGAGVSRDSVDYLGAAQSIRSGEGVAVPFATYNELPPADITVQQPVAMTTFPPLYPTVLAGVSSVTGTSPAGTARVVGALALPVTVLLAATLAWRRTRSALWPPLAAAALVLQPDILIVHSMVWSEPLTITLVLGLMLALTEYVDRPRAWLLGAGGCLAGAAVMTRYVAVATIPALIVAIALATPRPRRWRRYLVALLPALAPIAVWAVRNASQASGAARAQASWHPPTWGAAGAAAGQLLDWVSPAGVLRALGCVALLALAASCVAAAQRGEARAILSASAVVGVTAASFAAVLLVTWFLFDAALSTDFRVLSPLSVLTVVLAACSAGSAQHLWAAPWRLLGLAVVAVLGVVGCVRAATAYDGLPARLDYNAPPWLGSPTLALAESLPAGDLVVTNAPDFMWVRTGRVTVPEPRTYIAVSSRTNTAFASELDAIRHVVIHKGHGWLVLWNGGDRPYLPMLDQLTATLHSRVVETTSDGAVLELLP